jgi:demethylmenaquinone methyltransferase/2-methoxy-6-polyprenyl-1,4-benzoquinol methylase
MTSFLRPLAYRYRWIYDTVTAVSSLSVGGVERLRGLGLEALQPHLKPGAAVLDLCCGSGEAAAPWLAAGYAVTGLDVSPRALDLAAQRHPSLERVEGLAEDPPLADASFSAIQLSVALHEFPRSDREQGAAQCPAAAGTGRLVGACGSASSRTLAEAPQQLFCALFETDTATAMLEDDLPTELEQLGFSSVSQELLAGRALQRITATRPR